VESSEPCVLYASVVCEATTEKKKGTTEECKYSLKLTYESTGLQQVVIGQPQHNVVKDGTYNYYYLTVKQSSLREGQKIVSVLSSTKGNADLYVKFIDTP
jgi:glyceraldehyde-3-phosphate dehydrogenase/erythrose-4-phosphate dehydrogenase